MTPTRSIACAVVVLLSARTAAAGEPQAASRQTPPAVAADQPTVVTLPAGGLALLDTVRLTLQHSPTIRLQQTSVDFQEGVAQERRGLFDASVVGGLTHDYRIQELTETRKAQERSLRDELREGLAANQSNAANARSMLTILGQLRQSATTTPTQLDAIRRLDPLTATQLELMDTLIRTQPTIAAQLQQSRQQFLNDTVGAAEAGLQQGLQEFARQELRLTNIGAAPFDEVFYNSLLDFQLPKTFRAGFSVAPFFEGGSDGTNYRDKPRSADFGGKGIFDVFTFRTGADGFVPLARGRGVTAFGAAERAADLQVVASRATVQHELASSALDAIAAYWNLRAAQDSRAVAERSVALQAKVRDLTLGLIQAGELPQIEGARAQASHARAQARLQEAEQTRHQARVELATVMGLAVTDDDATLPTAGDPFPPVPDPALLDEAQVMALLNEAIDRRRDVVAVSRQEEAGAVQLRSARTDLRPKLDLQGSVWMTALDEAVVSRALDRWVGPSTSVTLDYEQPLGNNRFRGRVQQSEADLRRLQISSTDLKRRIRLNVIRAARSLQAAVSRVREAEAAVGFSRATIDAELERLRAGESTLIDTILTEEQQTAALLVLTSAQRDLATLIAELRYTVGVLVPDDPSTLTAPALVTVPRAGGEK